MPLAACRVTYGFNAPSHTFFLKKATQEVLGCSTHLSPSFLLCIITAKFSVYIVE